MMYVYVSSGQTLVMWTFFTSTVETRGSLQTSLMESTVHRTILICGWLHSLLVSHISSSSTLKNRPASLSSEYGFVLSCLFDASLCNVNNKFIQRTGTRVSSVPGCHLQYYANRNVFNWRLKLSIESSGSRRYIKVRFVCYTFLQAMTTCTQ